MRSVDYRWSAQDNTTLGGPLRRAHDPVSDEYEVDVRVRTVRYTLRQIYDEPRRVASEYLGDFRDFGGERRFEAIGEDRTRAELDLRIDPGSFVPRPLRTMIADAVMRGALRDLKTHLEA